MPRSPRPSVSPDSDRAGRRVQKRGRSRDRTAYNAELEAGVDPLALHAALNALVEEEADEDAGGTGRRPRPRAAASGNDGRWVPIGPSVIRRGQAMDRPHVVGRIRDLAVSPDGRRAYAASAKGGLWYTEDAGSTWSPVGAWIGGHRRAGGNNSVFVCGALLVEFGASQSLDFVLVGTGELVPFVTSSGAGRFGGVGILCARGPVFSLDTDNPWEPDTGLGVLEGLGIFRLVRRPGRTAGEVDPASRDEVLAATSAGLFRGVRRALAAGAAAPPFPALPAREGYEWSRVPGIAAGTQVTDARWITRGAGTRIVALVNGQGVEFSDDDGASFDPVVTLHRPAVAVTGRSSLAIAAGNRAYVLYDGGAGPAVAAIPDLTAAPPVATALTGVPTVWTDAGARDYDQAIAAEAFSGRDRIYLGGNTVMPVPGSQWSASLWALDVVGTALQARPAVSDTGAPPAAGADRAGLIGNNVHADVHAIRLPGAPAAPRPVWVACDGGVYVSTDSGRVNSFAAMNTGLAVSETGFIDSHPTVSHFLATGLQDNGTAVRTGDTVWEAVHLGDGGGLAFAPTAPDTLVAQYIRGFWRSSDSAFRDPLTRSAGGPNATITGHPEYTAARAEFYSACAAVRRPGVSPSPDTTRLALGTDRVYVSDTVGSGAATTWVVLPIVPKAAAAGATVAASDPFPSATVATQQFGVAGGFGRVISVAWISATELIVLYSRGILRQIEVSAGNWHTDWLVDPAAPPAALPGAVTFTEVAPVPGGRDFYVTTTGADGAALPDTVTFFASATSTFHATSLRSRLSAAAPPLGPRDPAYSVVVDPETPTRVYVGTKTGVWRGTRTDATGAHTWDPFVNGLPEATVQDLSIWNRAGGPRLLRAAIQSRGVWETDLAAPTPVVTYVRCHDFDDRRGPLAAFSPRASSTSVSWLSSPDVVVRPAWPAAAAPAFPQVDTTSPDAPLTLVNAGAFNTWTFQTAFRWWYPNVRADGQWTDAFGDLIEHDRRVRGMPGGRSITKALWDAVVGGTRLKLDSGRLIRSTDAADPLAVFRAPWHTTLAPDLAATEVDIMECVVPPTSFGAVWNVTAGPSVVEVLLHHRASEPSTPLTTSAGLMWRELNLTTNPIADASAPFVDWWTGVSAVPEQTVAAPAGWTVVQQSASTACHVLDVGLEARLPRAVPIPLDLTGQSGKLLVLAAFASSVADLGLQPAPAGITTLGGLIARWPHVAVRTIHVT